MNTNRENYHTIVIIIISITVINEIVASNSSSVFWNIINQNHFDVCWKIWINLVYSVEKLNVFIDLAPPLEFNLLIFLSTGLALCTT